MFSVVIMSNQNGGKSQKQSGIALHRLRMRLLSVIELFTNYILDHSRNTRDITVNGIGVYTLLHLPGTVQPMESILMSLLQ